MTAVRRGLAAMAALGLATAALACGGRTGTARPQRVKIGFLVKQPEETWFQNEWKFATLAATELGFDLVKIGAPDGERVLTAIDSLAAQGAGGFVICTPDVRLGPAIVAKARSHGLKVMSVDDQFVGADGRFMAVPHMGISAREIGRVVGRALLAEMQRRGYASGETGLCVPTRDELDTARERTEGAIESLLAAGFPAGRVFKAPQKTTDVPGGMDAGNIVLTQHPDVKRWLVCGMNDEAVLGVVRAMEGRGLKAADVIGIGIGGDVARVEFERAAPTGLFATVLISPRRHGYETAALLFHWIRDGVEPPPATFTSGLLVTRETYKTVMAEQGLSP
jgi:L-arabinose transport system substrate-binding protein